MHILLTRPEARSKELALRLHELGHVVSCMPVTELAPTHAPGPALDDEAFDGVVLTSASAAQFMPADAVAQFSDRRVLAIGPATGHAARQAGFRVIRQFEGEAEDLKAALAEHVEAGARRWLFPHGEPVTHSAEVLAQASGGEITPWVLYRSQAAQAWTEPELREFWQSPPDLVLFFSPRAAIFFHQQLEAEKLSATLQRSTAGCLSSRIAEAFDAALWRDVIVAPNATVISLLKACDIET